MGRFAYQIGSLSEKHERCRDPAILVAGMATVGRPKAQRHLSTGSGGKSVECWR